LILGHYFKQFKKACIIILRKPNKGNYIDFKVYKFIALLNTIEKALKSIIVRRFNDETKAKKLLPPIQTETKR